MLIWFVLGKKEKDVVIETKYTIENVIGNGGFGTVYAGKRKKDGHLASILLLCFTQYVHRTRVAKMCDRYRKNSNIIRIFV